MPINFRGGKQLTRTQLMHKVGSWKLANWIEHHGKGVVSSPESVGQRASRHLARMVARGKGHKR